jgi:hypothetical protein
LSYADQVGRGVASGIQDFPNDRLRSRTALQNVGQVRLKRLRPAQHLHPIQHHLCLPGGDHPRGQPAAGLRRQPEVGRELLVNAELAEIAGADVHEAEEGSCRRSLP